MSKLRVGERSAGRDRPPDSLQGAFSITYAQQVFPLAKLALESHALGDLKRRDDAALDLLASFAGAFTD